MQSVCRYVSIDTTYKELSKYWRGRFFTVLAKHIWLSKGFDQCEARYPFGDKMNGIIYGRGSNNVPPPSHSPETNRTVVHHYFA